MEKKPNVNRRAFINSLGVTVGGAGLAGAGLVGGMQLAKADQEPAKGKIPETPYKTGHVTFLRGPFSLIGAPTLKGHTLAAEEINAQGGLLGKRKIETIVADEAIGTDAVVKEMRRMKIDEKIDVFTGISSSANTPVLGPVAEGLNLLTLFSDGCTDLLFDKAVTNPKYVFRVSNIQSADAVTAAVAVAQTWPEVRKIAHIHQDYNYGRGSYEFFNTAIERLIPGTEIVSQNWPKFGTTDFSDHIKNIIAAKPDILVSSVLGGDYVAFYKQALSYGLFDKMKFANSMAFAIIPHALGKDHPEGVLVGVHSNYYFTYPGGDRWPANKSFVERYYKRWNEYPNFQAETSYTALYLLKSAIERANSQYGGWPEDEAIISQLESLGIEAPSGYLYMRRDHQGYKDTIIGFSKNNPEYPFQTLDLARMITVPIRNITAPQGWPKPGTTHNESTAAVDWMKKTWPKAVS